MRCRSSTFPRFLLTLPPQYATLSHMDSETYHVRLPKPLLRRLQRIAKREDRTMHKVMLMCLEVGSNQYESAAVNTLSSGPQKQRP